MYTPVRIATAAWVGLFGIVTATLVAPRGATPPPSAQTDVTTRIVASAQSVLATLDEAGRAKVQFPYDGPQKTRWSNLPSPMYQRNVLRLADLTPAQRASIMAMLAVALSQDGYRKIVDIMRGDEVLRKAQSSQGGRGRGTTGGGPAFGEDQYYLAFVGTPSTTAPWMLQFGGHHLAINLTLAASQATMAPSLPAAQ